MAYPLTTREAQTARKTAASRFDLIARRLKDTTEATRLASTAGPVTADTVLAYLDTLRGFYSEMQDVAAIPGIGADFPDIATEAAAVMNATLGTIQWIATNFPQEGGYLAAQQVNVTTGVVTWRSLSSAALAPLRTQMQALEATIA